LTLRKRDCSVSGDIRNYRNPSESFRADFRAHPSPNHIESLTREEPSGTPEHSPES